MLGYYCAYFRHYYPLEFLTSYLNNAANEDDIRMGTEYATKVGVTVTMPKWGISKSEYRFDREKNIIAKGLTSIKYMSNSTAEELFDLAHKYHFDYFTDLLYKIDEETGLNTRQLDILIKIDFFSEFGNQRELLRLTDMFYNFFKRGSAKKLVKDKIDGTPIAPIVQKYAVGTTKSGAEAKQYTLLDVHSIITECEQLVKSLHMEDLSDLTKVRNFADAMGYAGYVSGKDEDRRKLYILNVYELLRKRDGKQFGYSIVTKSIGSGKESRFTVFNNVYDTDPIHKGDIIYCKGYEKQGIYYTLTNFVKVY